MPPSNTEEEAAGWEVITGLAIEPPLLEEELDDEEEDDELDDDELLLELEDEEELLAPDEELEEDEELLEELAPPEPTASTRKVVPVLDAFLLLSSWTWMVWSPVLVGFPRLSGSIMR